MRTQNNHSSHVRTLAVQDTDVCALINRIGSVVEIILFLVLLLSTKNPNRFNIIRAAILGSILATMLLCLGLCFFAAGIRRDTATFDAAVSEVGTGLLLMAYDIPLPLSSLHLMGI